MFDFLVIGYLFLGGAGSGALIFLSMLELLKIKPKFFRAQRPGSYVEFPPAFNVRTWSLCFGVLAFAVLCLMLDLGRFDRLLILFLSPTPTAVTIGTYGLAVALVCSGIFSIRYLFDSVKLSASLITFFGLLGIVAGLTTAVYTGILLSSMASVLFWQTPFLPFLFLLSSLSTGLTCLFLGAVFTETRRTFIHALSFLVKLDLSIIVLELLCLAAYLFLFYLNPATEDAVTVLIFEDLAWVFWAGVVGCGLAIPLILEHYISPDNFRNQLLWVSFLVLLGGVLLRFSFVEIASFDVTQTDSPAVGLTSLSITLS